MKFFIIIKENSVRVPDKNFRKVGGKVLWERMIDKLKGEEVYIDTDSLEIIDKCNSSYPWVNCYLRDSYHVKLENDKKFQVSPVLKMIERFLSENVIDDEEIIVTPHVTSPFISLKTMKDAANKIGEEFETVQACTSHQEFAYYKDKAVNFNEDEVPKTQDLEPILLGNGAFFIFTKKIFMKYGNRVSPKRFFYPLNFKESIEIDTLEDLEIANTFAQ